MRFLLSERKNKQDLVRGEDERRIIATARESGWIGSISESERMPQ